MKIVVMGGLGNYGLTVSGLAMEQGHDITILQFPGTARRIATQPEKNYEPLIRKFEESGGKFEFHYREYKRTQEYHYQHGVIRNADDIPEDAEVIIIAYPSLIHENIGRLLKERIKGKTIITFTDRFLGGFSLLKAAESFDVAQLISVGATPVTSFEDRENPFRRIVYSDKKNVRIAFHPASQAKQLTEMLQTILPADYLPYGSLLELAFNCTPSNLHAPHDLMNLVRYESGHDFTMFHEGFTPGIERLIEQVSQERCAIAQAFGLTATSFLEYERKTYGYTGDSITENRRLNPQLNQVPAPESLWSCKGIEDVACALVPLSEFARISGVPCPMIDALIAIWSCYLNVDFREQGRTLTMLGLSGKTIQQIKDATT